MELLLPIIHERDTIVGKKPSQRLQAETAAPAELELQLLLGSPQDTHVGQGKFPPSLRSLLLRGCWEGLCLCLLCCSSSGMSLHGGGGDHPPGLGISTLPGPSAAREQLLPCWVKCPWGTGDLDRLWGSHWFGTELEVPNLALLCSCVWWSSRAWGQVTVT